MTKLLNHLINHLNHLTNHLNHLTNQPSQPFESNQAQQPSHQPAQPSKHLSLNNHLKLLCLNKPPSLKNQIHLCLYKLPYKGKLGLSLQLRGKPSWQSLSHGNIENLSSVLMFCCVLVDTYVFG
ncbi:hypothetical protein Pyn_17937 [Prunus yedoensis var. nudiflora]|uniref:Uncharacterized protein n=1 Tax=Prunus yedoensis var. nudiflora TaxID=2094558 RepID=A0A314YJS2_PRUYE|nr:hypothetical protein Pyn_17937 [Prunus yedoensis var. nudiflora]